MPFDMVIDETFETRFASEDADGTDASLYGDELYVASEPTSSAEMDGAILVVAAADGPMPMTPSRTVLDEAATKGPLLIVAEDVEGEALADLEPSYGAQLFGLSDVDAVL